MSSSDGATTGCGVHARDQRRRRFPRTPRARESGCLKPNLGVPKMESRFDHAVKSANTQLTKMRWAVGLNGLLAIAVGVLILVWRRRTARARFRALAAQGAPIHLTDRHHLCEEGRSAIPHSIEKGATMTNDTHAEHEFRNATVIGGGVIGISWTALFLAHGLQVTVSDPLPDVQDRVHAGLRDIAPTLEKLGLPVAALEEESPALTFEADADAAVAAADVVQENAPEHLDIKQELWQAIERAAPAHTLFASSSSTLPASETAKGMQAPGRLIVGHPFNPPHLVPLVEVAPSKTTDPAVVDLAVAFYTSVGKRPQVLGREIPGFIANRLQAALFREAVYLVSQGIVSEQALDDVVTSSIG